MQRRRLMQAFNAGLSDHTQTPVEPSAIAPSFGETTGLFQIPWDKFPTELLKAMMEGTRPRPSLRREMVRIIVSDLLAVEQKRPGRRVLRQIARELVKKYPRSFCDVCGDNIVGTGFDSLMLQLENRVDNCSRSVPLRSKRPAEGDPVSRKSKKRYDRYGCVQWQPDLPATEDGPSQTVKKMELRNSYAKKKLPETCVRKLMAETYYSQRLSINADNKTVGELKSEWPYLFEASHFFDHTERLLGVPVHKKLAEELSRKGNTIVNFLRQTRATQFAGIEEKLRDPLELLSSVGSYLGDNTEVLLIQKQGLNPATLSLPSTPCIIILGNKRFQIAVDQTVVNDHVCCPLTALSYLFSLFYVLNIRYPKDAALSLEFIQRSLLGINPGRGTKVERRGKKQHKIHPKLLKFLSELSDYQNPWTFPLVNRTRVARHKRCNNYDPVGQDKDLTQWRERHLMKRARGISKLKVGRERKMEQKIENLRVLKKKDRLPGLVQVDEEQSLAAQFQAGPRSRSEEVGKHDQEVLEMYTSQPQALGLVGPNRCVVCGRTFNSRALLKIHLRVHSGEKPYHCTFCDKNFRQSSHLSVHVRIHTGEKPYSCLTCGKRFSDRSACNRHVRAHLENPQP